MDDIDIVRRVKSGDGETFSLLVEKYHKHLLNFIFRIVRDERTVEDIGQEVFLSVYKSLHRFDENRGTPFSAWLFITARNRCISELRTRRGKEYLPIEDFTVILSKEKTAEENLLKNEQEQALAASLAQLPEPYRSTIFKSLRGDSLGMIATAEGVSPGTVKSRLFRARERLKTLLNEYFGGKGYEGI